MSADELHIEQIVQQVIRQLQQAGVEVAAGPVDGRHPPAATDSAASGDSGGTSAQHGQQVGPHGGPAAGCPSVTPPKSRQPSTSRTTNAGQAAGRGVSVPNRAELVLSGKVITLEQIADRLGAIRRLVVSPRAVITPAVRDELLMRGIQVVRRSEGDAQVAAAKLAFWVTGERFDAASLVAALEAEGVSVQCHRSECLIAATDAAAGAITAERTPAGILTRQPAVAVCLANRHPGVRAVWIPDPLRAETHIETTGANLLVLDPQELPMYQMKQLLAGLARAGLRACPEELKSRLG